jgi:multidrug efflux pump subunit AcrA (membrane-fusion protein)
VFWSISSGKTIHFRPGGVYHSSMRAVRAGIVFLALGVAEPQPAGASEKAVALRLQGSVEPVRSHPVTVPRMSGSTGPGAGTLIIVHLAKPGTRVKRGDLLIEFDRQAQIKIARDRQAEYLDFVEQINKKRGEQVTASAHGEAEVKKAENVGH